MIWQLCWNMLMMFHPPNCWSRWSSPAGELIYTSTTSHIVYYSSQNIPIIIPLSKMALILWRSMVQNSYQSSLHPSWAASNRAELRLDPRVSPTFRPGRCLRPSRLASAARRLVQQLRFSQHWLDSFFHDIPLNIHTTYRAPCDSNHQINVMCPHPMIFIMNKQRMSVMYTTSPNPEIPMSYIIQSEPLKILLLHWWNIAWLKTLSLFYMGFFIFQLPGNIAPEPIANQQKGITSNGSIAVQIIPISNINTQWVL